MYLVIFSVNSVYRVFIPVSISYCFRIVNIKLCQYIFELPEEHKACHSDCYYIRNRLCQKHCIHLVFEKNRQYIDERYKKYYFSKHSKKYRSPCIAKLP